MKKILETLDALGLALADHDHTWTDRERQLYESAVISCGGYTEISSEDLTQSCPKKYTY